MPTWSGFLLPSPRIGRIPTACPRRCTRPAPASTFCRGMRNPVVPAQDKASQESHLYNSNFIEPSLFLGYIVLALAANRCRFSGVELRSARRLRRWSSSRLWCGHDPVGSICVWTSGPPELPGRAVRPRRDGPGMVHPSRDTIPPLVSQSRHARLKARSAGETTRRPNGDLT